MEKQFILETINLAKRTINVFSIFFGRKQLKFLYKVVNYIWEINYFNRSSLICTHNHISCEVVEFF